MTSTTIPFLTEIDSRRDQRLGQPKAPGHGGGLRLMLLVMRFDKQRGHGLRDLGAEGQAVADECLVYVRTLARERDQFESQMTGEDRLQARVFATGGVFHQLDRDAMLAPRRACAFST